MTDASHLLVVDGSRVSRTVIARGLRAEIGGADVTACASAGEGLKACASGRFDCITAVLPLPDMGGDGLF